MWRIAFFMVIATVGAANQNGDEELYYSLMKYGIVPEVIPFCPVIRFPVVFSNNNAVQLGNELYLSDVESEPVLSYQVEHDAYYTLAFIDAGVTMRITHDPSTYLLWFVVNIKGNDVESGHVVFPYEKPLPIEAPTGTSFPAFHRYVFLVYIQSKKFNSFELTQIERSIGDRSGFSVADFLFPYNMSIPLFGNFFLARYNDHSHKSSEDLPTKEQTFDNSRSIELHSNKRSSEEPSSEKPKSKMQRSRESDSQQPSHEEPITDEPSFELPSSKEIRSMLDEANSKRASSEEKSSQTQKFHSKHSHK